jgi:hypothetical protein
VHQELALEYRFRAILQRILEQSNINAEASIRWPISSHGVLEAFIKTRAGTFVTTMTGISQLNTNLTVPLKTASGYRARFMTL